MHETNDVIKERTIRNQYYRGNIGFPSGSSTGLPTCNDLLRSIIWYANYIGRDRLPVNFKRPPQRGYTVLKCGFNPWTIRTSIRTMVAENFSPNFRMHSCVKPEENPDICRFLPVSILNEMTHECFRDGTKARYNVEISTSFTLTEKVSLARKILNKCTFCHRYYDS